MAKTRPSDGSSPTSAPTGPPPPNGDRTRCAWTTRGQRCLLRGTAIYGSNDHETRYCAWHDTLRTPTRVAFATDFDELERWCLDQRARGYCGAHYEFSHAEPRWLFGLLTGDDQTPLEPAWRVGCARTSCPYGWNGQRVRDAFAPVTPADPSRPRPR